jgi:hypothetical protein
MAKTTRAAILILPGDEDNSTLVDIETKGGAPRYKSLAKALGAERAEQWPPQYTLEALDGGGGRKYSYDLFVDEEGVLKGLPYNRCATLSAHPLGEARVRWIHGPCVLIARDRRGLTLDDWKRICQAVYYDDDLVEKNARGPIAGW